MVRQAMRQIKKNKEKQEMDFQISQIQAHDL